MKIVIPGLVAFALWSWVCVQWYVCGIHELCEDNLASVEEIEPVSELPSIDSTDLSVTPEEYTEPAALSFDWSGAEPLLGPSFANFRDSLEQIFNEDPAAVVQITGIYDPQELNDTGYNNLGLARAQAVKDLLLSLGIKRAINIGSQTEDLSSYLGSQIIEGVRVSLVPPIPLEGFAVVRRGRKLTIHFPADNENPGSNQQVLESLRRLAREAKSQQSNVLVVGHTDNQGDAQENMVLGLKRASAIKEILMEAGLEESAVLEESEGGDRPIANNGTTSGRRLNRRVELTII